MAASDRESRASEAQPGEAGGDAVSDGVSPAANGNCGPSTPPDMDLDWEPEDEAARQLARQLMLDDLKRSGITPTNCLRFDDMFKPHTAAQTKALTGFADVPSYQHVYFDFDGKPTGYARLRFLAEVRDRDGKGIRYWQPKGSVPHLYIPPVIDWGSILTDRDKRVTVVEGAKKALALTLVRHPAVGIDGVSSFGSTHRGLQLIPDLQKLAASAKGRIIEICFDADLHHKPEVAAALYQLMCRLLDAGCRPVQVILPSGGPKGADDYLVAYGADAYGQLPREEFALVKPLWHLNAGYAYLRSPAGSVLRLHDGQVMQPQAFHLESTAHVKVNTGKQVKEFKATNYWLDKWGQRREYVGVDYVPGAPSDLPDGKFNIWRDDGVKPERGKIRPFVTLMENLVPDRQARWWMISWLAHLLQYRDKKLQSAPVLHGKPGQGKTTFAYVLLRKIFGPGNASKIGSEELKSQWTHWLKAKQIVVAEEIAEGDARRLYDTLKDKISSETLIVNEKYVAQHEIKNFAHLLFLSNHRSPVYFTKDDRRYAVSQTANKLNRNEIKAIRAWIESGGAARVRFFLEHFKLDARRFDPYADPPWTDDKKRAAEAGERAVETLLREFVEDGDAPRYFTFDEMHGFAKRESDDRLSPKALSNYMEDLEDAGQLTKVKRILLDPSNRGKKRWIWAKGKVDRDVPEDKLRTLLAGCKAERQAYFGPASPFGSFSGGSVDLGVK